MAETWRLDQSRVLYVRRDTPHEAVSILDNGCNPTYQQYEEFMFLYLYFLLNTVLRIDPGVKLTIS